jgi:PilZ domain
MNKTASRRKSHRHRLLKSGKIILGKAAEIPCVVRNLSSLGACLEVQGTFAIPPEFDFALSTQPVRTCKIIWRDDKRLGVMFIERE